MTDEQTETLRMYVNDMLAVEKDIFHAVSGQVADKNIKSPDVAAFIQQMATKSGQRIKILETLSARHEGKIGAIVKEAVATATGTLAGIYDKVRKHPVSRMLRDDYVALSLASVAYGMLYTTALAFDDDAIADAALENLNEINPQIMEVTKLIPAVVVSELSESSPVTEDAADIALEAIEASWQEASATSDALPS